MNARLEPGDCLEVLPLLADIGEQFDACITDPPYHLTSTVKRFGGDNAAPAKAGVYGRSSAGFMGKTWDGGDIAFQPETWRAVWDTLKPGAYLLAFGGTRTFHRMAVAIEDAGFDIRDTIMWIYGTGFPKSHDVSKGIDKSAGVSFVAEPAAGVGFMGPSGPGGYNPTKNRLRRSGASTHEAAQWAGWGTALKPAWEPIIVARKPLVGTVAANVLAHGTGALNIDASRIPAEKPTGWGGGAAGGVTWTDENCGLAKGGEARPVDGRWPANVIHDGSDEVLEAFPGTAARFFYSAKATAADRAFSKHPTVKPLALLRYLCRMVTQPGGRVLDPFAGSGTLLQAAHECGFSAVGIERDPTYQADVLRRLAMIADPELAAMLA